MKSVQSRCTGAHQCSTSIPWLFVTVGAVHRSPGVTLGQVWGSVMLQPLPWVILPCISHPSSLLTATGSLVYRAGLS